MLESSSSIEKLKGLRQRFSTLFMSKFEATPTIYQTIAQVEESDSLETIYPMKALSVFMKERRGEIELENIRSIAYTVSNTPFDAWVELDLDALEDNQFKNFFRDLDQLAVAAAKHYDEVTVEALMAGTSRLCLDGLAYFSDVHPIDPTDPDSATQSNLKTGRALSQANLVQTMLDMRLMKSWGKRQMRNRATHLIVPPQLEQTGINLVKNNMILAASNNTLQPNNTFGTVELVVLDELQDEGTVWYLGNLGTSYKPLLLQKRQNPDFKALDDPSSELCMLKRKALYGVQSRTGSGYTFPHLMIRCEQ